MNNNGKEIERKFLIAYPTQDVLKKCYSRSEIEQTYLTSEEKGMSARVRKRVYENETIYTHTEKKHITSMTRIENEEVIDKDRYDELLKYADEERNVISKVRYCLNYEGQDFEIDIYPFWNDRAVMELELSNEEQEIRFPDFIKIIKELTQDKRYTNASMAKSIPDDELSMTHD